MDDIRKMLNNIRHLLNEAEEEEKEKNTEGAHPYSNQDEIMTNTLNSCKTQFGADFSKFKTPMLYYPKDDDVTLSGEIPALNAKFQFRLKDPTSDGLYIWANTLVLTQPNLEKLIKLRGVFKNWIEELSTTEDIKPMDLKNGEQ